MNEKIGMEIRVLSKYIGRYLNTFHTSRGISGPQGLILIYISQAENDVYQRDIEKFFNIRRSTATGLINSLEEKGYILRESVASDARLKKLVLTDKAKDTVHIIDDQVEQLEEKILKGIDKKEIEQFRNIIERMTRNLLEDSENE